MTRETPAPHGPASLQECYLAAQFSQAAAQRFVHERCAAVEGRVLPCDEITDRVAVIQERHRLGHRESAEEMATIVRRIRDVHLGELEGRR